MKGVRDNFNIFKMLLAAELASNVSAAALSEVNARLGKGVKVIDHVIYGTKKAAGQRIQFFESSDNKVVGVTNVNNQKLEKSQTMLLERITILAHQYADGTAITNAYIGKAAWSGIPTNGDIWGAMQNAILTIRTDKQIVIFERSIRDLVDEDGNGSDAEKGTLVLATPKFLIPEGDLEVTLDLAPDVTLQRTLLRVELKGLTSQVV